MQMLIQSLLLPLRRILAFGLDTGFIGMTFAFSLPSFPCSSSIPEILALSLWMSSLLLELSPWSTSLGQLSMGLKMASCEGQLLTWPHRLRVSFARVLLMVTTLLLVYIGLVALFSFQEFKAEWSIRLFVTSIVFLLSLFGVGLFPSANRMGMSRIRSIESEKGSALSALCCLFCISAFAVIIYLDSHLGCPGR